jgi:hypothetical protein
MNTHDFIIRARDFGADEQMEIVNELCGSVGPCHYLADAQADCLKLRLVIDEQLAALERVYADCIKLASMSPAQRAEEFGRMWSGGGLSEQLRNAIAKTRDES